MMTERAVLAGGCFWGMQELYPLEIWCHHNTRRPHGRRYSQSNLLQYGTHAEAIEISLDPERTSYRDVL